MNALYLAFAYLRYHWARSLVMVLVAALILFVPVATQILLSTSERTLTARADATPLILGTKGSQLDLTMAALYFSEERPDTVPMREVEAIWDSGFGTPIPVHTAFSSGGFRIVGTTLDYFDFRGLTFAQGRGRAVPSLAQTSQAHWARNRATCWCPRPKISSISTGSTRWKCPLPGFSRRQIPPMTMRSSSTSRQHG